MQRAWELNAPMVCSGAAATGTSAASAVAEHSWFGVEGPAILETLKPAEDGHSWILRLYEPYGSRGPVTVRTPLAITSVVPCNHVEEKIESEQPRVEGTSLRFSIQPFQVKSFRLAF